MLHHVHALLLSHAALLVLLQSLVVILVAIAAVMITVVVDAEKNVAGGNSGKTKIAATNAINVIADADATQVADAITAAVAIAATSNLQI